MEDKKALELAMKLSTFSECKRRYYGAVILNTDGFIIARGNNSTPLGVKSCEECSRVNSGHNTNNYDTCRSIHAEQECIIEAEQLDMVGGTLYLYGTNADGSNIHDVSPCPICKRMIIEAGISKVVACSCSGVMKEYLVSDWIKEMNE